MSTYRFCPKCGDHLQLQPPSETNVERPNQNQRPAAEIRESTLAAAGVGSQPRLTCRGCGFIFYRNPAVGVAVALLDGQRILLGRRSRGVYQGHWCIPCGYVEWGEDVREAARREFLEETGLEVEIGPVYTVHSNFHNPESLTVGIWFRGVARGGSLRADDDLDAVQFFPLDDLPEPLAFPTDRLVLDQLRREMLDSQPQSESPEAPESP